MTEKDVSDTLMMNVLDIDAKSITDDQRTHEKAKCDPFESPRPLSTNHLIQYHDQ